MKNKDDENMKNYIAKEIEERGKDAITSFCFSVFDTLVYAAKDTFQRKILKTNVSINQNKSVFGGPTDYTKYGGKVTVHKNNYANNYTNNRQMAPVREIYSRDVYDYQYIQFNSRASADFVLHKLRDTISQNGYVTVSEYYRLSGERSSQVDAHYGWNNLDGVVANRNMDGSWTLIMPKAIEISQED